MRKLKVVTMNNEIRVQKLLANLGFGSRRGIEELIKSQQVKLNTKICTLGDKAKVGDTITINNKKITVTNAVLDNIANNTRIIIYHKPEGEICSHNDEQGRKTVYDNLPKLKNGKWISIGRLDINTSGLLLFTNNGKYANKLMHPSSNIEREYLLKTSIPPTPRVINKLIAGVELEDGPAKFLRLTPKHNKKDNKWFYAVITEGRNREVRRLWESQDIMVSKLIRIRFGDFVLPKDLAKGSYIEQR